MARRRWLVLGLLVASSVVSAKASAADVTMRCTLHAPARVTIGDPVPLRFTLANTGSTPVHLLVWGTPFEGWRAPFVTVRRDGAALPYRGPSVKRGDPGRDEYLTVAPGRRRSATFDLAEAFDLRRPGRYRVEPHLVLHDVVPGTGAGLPRPRAQHAPVALSCNGVEVVVRPAHP